MKVREHTKKNILYWGLSYVALLVHSSALMGFSRFIVEILLYSLISMGIMTWFTFSFDKLDPDAVDDEAINFIGENYFDNLFGFIRVLPITAAVIVIYISQINQNYDSTYWWTYVIGGMVGTEIGNTLRYNKHFNNDKNRND